MVEYDGRRWQFHLACDGVHQVFLVGDFNNWTHTQPMEQIRPGRWRASLALPAGTYRFRYCADGRWITDFAAFGVIPNHLDGWDSVVHVEPDCAAKMREDGRAA